MLLGVTLTFLMLASCSPKVLPDSTTQSKQVIKTYPDSLPFVLTDHNNMIISSVLNHQDSLELMLHTAASDVSITHDAAAKISQTLEMESSQAGSWGGGGEINSSENNHIKIGHTNWDSVTLWINQNSGPESDGKFGPALFYGKTIEVNHDLNQIIIHDQAPNISENPMYQKFNLEMDHHSMYITGIMTINDEIYENKFLIHTGYGGTILIDDEYASTHQFNDHLKIISESQLKDSFDNVLKTKKAILPGFQIGDQSFENMPISFFEGKIGPVRRSVIGGGLLKRFNMIIAIHEGVIYLKPNDLMNKPFENS